VAIKLYLGRDYYGWRHADIKTHRVHFRADGSSFVTGEACAIFLKDL
jgi:hypothetical protein